MYERKVKLITPSRFPQKLHRSGWNEVIRALHDTIHCNNATTLLDDCIEATLGWETNNEGRHRHPWIGIAHFPLNIRPPFPTQQSPQYFFKQHNVIESLKFCKGIFTLSETLKGTLASLLPDRQFELESILHPTDFGVPKFDLDKFLLHPTVIQIGWWMRNFSSFYMLKTPYEKLIVMGQHPIGLSVQETYKAEIKQSRPLNEIPSLDYLDNNGYDLLLQRAVVFLDLLDSSANNAILECLSRGTPLLVNHLPAVEEYLGREYPLYYTSLEEGIEKLHNSDLLKAAAAYLLEHSVHHALTYDHFLQKLTSSKIYKNLT